MARAGSRRARAGDHIRPGSPARPTSGTLRSRHARALPRTPSPVLACARVPLQETGQRLPRNRLPTNLLAKSSRCNALCDKVHGRGNRLTPGVPSSMFAGKPRTHACGSGFTRVRGVLPVPREGRRGPAGTLARPLPRARRALARCHAQRQGQATPGARGGWRCGGRLGQLKPAGPSAARTGRGVGRAVLSQYNAAARYVPLRAHVVTRKCA